MKKLVLSVVAIMALATTGSAQIYGSGLNLSTSSLYSIPTVPSIPSMPSISSSYSVPSVTYSLPSTVNMNSTTVSGYYRSSGSYVESHVRTMPNSTNWDNYSTLGNLNPLTGSMGSIARDYSTGSYNYGAGQTIFDGPCGGQFYYNSNGNKTYVPKRSLW